MFHELLSLLPSFSVLFDHTARLESCISDSICCHGNDSAITNMVLQCLCRTADGAHMSCEGLVLSANLQ